MPRHVISGLWLWIGMGALAGIVPSPYGLAIYFAFIAIHTGVYGIVLWKRTGLALSACASLCGAVFMGTASVLTLRGLSLVKTPLEFLGPTIPWAAAGWICHLIDRKRNPERLALLEASAKGRSFWDVPVFPVIPRLKD